MESITIKVNTALAREIDRIMRPHYSTKTDFIREAIRDKIKGIEEEKTIRELRKYFGKAKTKTSYKEEREIREKVGKEYLKKFGIKLD